MTTHVRRFAAVLLIVGAISPAAAPAPPAPTIVDACDYADAASARAAWRPMGGSAEVEPVRLDGLAAVRMPCNFRGTKIERASWDRTVRLDMADCRGLQFRMLCRDLSPVAYFTAYLQSGGGWYVTTFAPERRDGWSTVTIRKEDTRIEGTPAGWGTIGTIRLSAWRGGDTDTEFAIADVRLVGGGESILVVRGDSVVARSPGEADSVRQFSQAIVRALGGVGLECGILSDTELSADRLRGRRLVILPHNPGMPDETADILAAYLAGGGKLMAFYTLPARLADAVGMGGGVHVREKSPGQFASIRFAAGALAGAPPQVAQHSWNIHTAKPIEGKSRVVATWFDADGQDTGHPAVLASDNGIYMTHVLLDGDAANQGRMLLAMAGRLVPEAWAQAARGSLDRVGRMGRFAGFDEARAAVSGATAAPREAKDLLAQAVKRRDEAAGLLAKQQFPEAIAAADDAHRLLADAWATAQTPQPGEHRAFWCHSAFGVTGMTWDEAAKRLAENGFTAVIPNMCWAGAAYYESAVLPVAPEVKEKGDQIAACLAACRKVGLQCHVWKVNWNMSGHAPREFAERMARDGRTQIRFDGKAEPRWLCPSQAANQQLEIDSMVEVAMKYAVDGIHFDYIRYPGPDGCFCPRCREAFEKILGGPVKNWPADCRKDAAVAPRWLDFRRDNITRVVAGTSDAVRKARPKMKISAAVFGNWPVDRDSVSQDWKLWCERGYLDFVCPMDYTPHLGQFEAQVAQQIGWAGKAACYPGIGLSVWPRPTDPVKLFDFIAATRRLKTGGFTIFEYRATEARDVVPLCGKGMTRKMQ